MVSEPLKKLATTKGKSPKASISRACVIWGPIKRKSPCKGALFKDYAPLLFRISDTSHFTDHSYFYLSRILHIAFNFLGDVKT